MTAVVVALVGLTVSLALAVAGAVIFGTRAARKDQR